MNGAILNSANTNNMRTDEVKERNGGWLATLNPIVKLAATLPWMGLSVCTRDFATPAMLSALAALAMLCGARFRAKTVLVVATIVIVVGAWVAFIFALLVSPDVVAATPPVLSRWPGLRTGALWIGAATSMRLIALIMLGLLGTLGTTMLQLASALVHQCRIPYRYAYAATLSARFVPRYQRDIATLRDAQHARGIIDARGPIGWLRRTARSMVPLLASGVRHAERLSMAMDARGFGAYSTRTERHPARVTVRDVIFFCAVWGVAIAVLVLSWRLGWLRFSADARQFS